MVSIPVGVDDDTGVPFSLGLIHSAGNEAKLVRYASAIEHLIAGRTRPGFRNVDARNYILVRNGH